MSKEATALSALKLALEALENSIDLVSNEAREAEKLYGKYQTRLARIQGLVALEVAHEKAITAVREALTSEAKEQPALCAPAADGVCESLDCPNHQPAPATELREQEPVAEVKAKMTGGNVGIATVIHEIYSPMRHPLVPGDLLYAYPVNQAPVGWMHSRTGLFYSLSVKPDDSGLLDEPTDKALLIYTSPPTLSLAQRTWVGLTNNELQPIADEYRILFGSWVEDFARAIEAKLKAKNFA